MDPQAERTPGLALPKPSSERGAEVSMPLPPPVGSHEAMLPSLETPPSAAGTSPLPAASSAPLSVPSVAPPVVPIVQPSAAVSAASDDSSSALDEEWINKAKAIVEQTKHDPHLESLELSKVKADYLRIRYNKHIKVAEEHNT